MPPATAPRISRPHRHTAVLPMDGSERRCQRLQETFRRTASCRRADHGKSCRHFALVSRGHRSDRTPPRESPRHFAARMDESVIVGYYTSAEVHPRSPARLLLSKERKKPMARNDGIDRTFARNQDLPTLDDVAKVQEHNEREKDSYSNQDIDTTQTHRNVHFKKPTDSYAAMFDQMIADGVISTRGLKADAVKYGEQIENEKTHYAALVDQYETARSLRHDIANHMYTIQALLSSGDTEQAAKYAAEIIPRHTFSSTLGQCENRIVDAFMASRLEKLKDSGIRIETDIALPYESRIANADMIIALGNMLNNAEEACRAVKGAEPFIRIWAREENGCCTIRMENSAAAADTRKKARIHGLERGLGTGIINNIARQYNGTFITGTKGGVFSAALTMQVPAETQTEQHTEEAGC